MGLIRTPLPVSLPAEDPALLCGGLAPGHWLVEPGSTPPEFHQPPHLLPATRPGSATAISLRSTHAIALNLGPALTARLAALGCALPEIAGLALHELLTNAIVHGNLGVVSGPAAAWSDFVIRQAAIEAALDDPARAARLVTVMFAWNAQEAVVAIADEGAGYDPDCTPGPCGGAGRGLAIARAAGELTIRQGGRQAVLRIPLAPLPPSGAAA
jgi:hypothetical protein